MAGFATSYLKEIDGPDDWVCVSDTCCGYSSLLGRGTDTTACWSPSRKLVAFGNNWGDVIPMPAETQPTEDAVYAWVESNPGWLQRMIDGRLKKDAEWKARMDTTQAFYDKHGTGFVHVEYRKPCGEVVIHDEQCGIHGPLFMLRLAVNWMLRNLPKGTTVQKLRVSRRVPAHRKEIKLCEKTTAIRRAKTA